MEKIKNEMIKTIMKALSFDCVQSTPAENAPFGIGNADCLNYILAKCQEFGFQTKNLDGYCGFADIGDNGNGDTFGILGHLDTVPIGKGWTKNPFGEICDDTIYGRGIMDDKGPMISCMYAIKALLDEGLTPKRKIRLIFGCNEESGWKCIDHYNKTEKMPDFGFSPDADFPVINCEKGIVNFKLTKPYNNFTIFGGERANVVPDECNARILQTDELIDHLENTAILEKPDFSYKFENGLIKITTYGKSAHGSAPQEGDNAIIKMLKLLSPFDDDCKTLYQLLYAYTGDGCGLKLSDNQSGHLTVNLGIIQTDGKNISVVLDIRYPVTILEDTILNTLTSHFKGYTITKTHFHLPLYVDKDDVLVQTLLNTYNNVMGEKANPIAIGGGTYARAMKKGVAYGPLFPNEVSTIHQPDERVSIDNLMKMTKIYYHAIKAICF